MSNLFGFVNDIEKIIYGLGFKLILKRNNNDRALFRVNAGADAVGNDGKIDIREISWCVPRIENFIYLFDEKHQRGKPNNKECPRTDSVCGKRRGSTDLSNNISVNTNEDLQSWLNDDNIITAATLPEIFRCIISGPSEWGKTFLLKKTNSG